MKFLVDECLSPSLVPIAHDAGYEAAHVTRIGKASWKDWNIFQLAIETDSIVVTNNVTDFRRLYASATLHAGLVLLLPNLNKEVQARLFRAALAELASHGDLTNQALAVDLAGERVSSIFYELPVSG